MTTQGTNWKNSVKQILDSKGLAYKDFGTDSTESCDYPDYAHPLAKAVEAGEVYPGIAICGSGNGIAMTLNKHQGIRAALCWQEEIARLAREHNNANILVMPGRFISQEEATHTVEAFLSHPVRRRSASAQDWQNSFVKANSYCQRYGISPQKLKRETTIILSLRFVYCLKTGHYSMIVVVFNYHSSIIQRSFLRANKAGFTQ